MKHPPINLSGYERFIFDKPVHSRTAEERKIIEEAIKRRGRINKRRKNTKIVYNLPKKK